MHTQSKNDSDVQKSIDPEAEQILDTAILLAHKSSWEEIRLYQVANELGLKIQDIHRHYRQKDDLVEAWYDRADRAMLLDAGLDDYAQLTPRACLQRSIMCWLTSMQEHRVISRQMLAYKFEFGHVHLQVLGLLRISRTVQWMLESAHRDAVHARRVIEEVTLSSIYLATFARWMFDDSPNAEATSRYLNRLLSRAEAMKLLAASSVERSSKQESAARNHKISATQGDFEGKGLH